ncbi:MAG: hypothetical protein JO023_16220, partial [Chloroflexi bacterium]|nr:hypothetical protein [Chloroflexota bacterium]
QDGLLYLLNQLAPSGGWSGWVNLGSPAQRLSSDAPAATLLNLIDLTGLGVFATDTDSAVQRRLQLLPDEPWQDWQSLGGSLDSSPTAVLASGGVNYLFGVDLSGALEENSDVTGGWLPHPGAEPLNGTPAVAAGADGRLELFAVTTVGTLAHQWQVPSGGWSGWYSHGSPRESTVYPGLALAPSADGRLELFAIGADLALYHIWQTAPNNGWSPWYSHGNAGAGAGPQPIGSGLLPAPAVAPARDGRLELFVVGTDGFLYHTWQTAPNNGWSPWYSHGNGGSPLLPSPAVAPSEDGRLEVFATGSDGALYHTWQTAPNNGWSGWVSHGSP